jgi:hypothetical protein
MAINRSVLWLMPILAVPVLLRRSKRTNKTILQSLVDSVGCTTGIFFGRTASRLISFRKPDGLAVSTGNLYFTSHDAGGATVWRTSQNSVPGQESVLYWEPGARFGDIVFAQVAGVFFGYFFAQRLGFITIRRIPLSGGEDAAVVTPVTNVDIANSHRNLVTDGENLYWQDDSAIRKVSIHGGPITVLDQTRPNTPTAGLVLHNDDVIYADVDEIRRVPKEGAVTVPFVRAIARASSPVTMLHVGLSGVYWGERGGAIRRKRFGSTQIKTLPGTSNLIPTAIATNGIQIVNGNESDARIAWTRCGSQSCELVRFPAAVNPTQPIGDDALGVFITTTNNIFWGDAAGVHRQQF